MSTDVEVLEAAAEALVPVRRRVGGHGGDVEVVAVRDGVAEVRFVAACEHCPAQALTFMSAVRESLLAVPGVRSVEAPQVRVSRFALERMSALLDLTPVATSGSEATTPR